MFCAPRQLQIVFLTFQFQSLAPSKTWSPPRSLASARCTPAMAGRVKQRRGLIETSHAKLDALVYTNSERRGGAAVILHPYALLGGSMEDHVVAELFR